MPKHIDTFSAKVLSFIFLHNDVTHSVSAVIIMQHEEAWSILRALNSFVTGVILHGSHENPARL